MRTTSMKTTYYRVEYQLQGKRTENFPWREWEVASSLPEARAIKLRDKHARLRIVRVTTEEEVVK